MRAYVVAWKQARRSGAVGYVPLANPPGLEAPCDWSEAQVAVAGVAQTVFLVCLRRCHSLASVVSVVPTSRQECFFAGHAAAFASLGLVPQRVADDTLTSAAR